MTNLTYHSGERGYPGYLTYITGSDSITRGTVVPAYVPTNSAGAELGTAGNPLVTTGGTGTGSTQAQGAQARGAAITVNPLLGGYRASTTAPAAVAAGQLVDPWGSTAGAAAAFLVDSAGTAVAVRNGSAGADGTNNAVNTLSVTAFTEVYNGGAWDRSRKPNIFARVASSAASGNPAFLKASAGDVCQFWGMCGATATFLQLYNKATPPTIGTDTPALTYPLIASAPFSQTIPNGGAYFNTGISYAFTTDAAGTTASAAAAVTAFALLGA